MYIHYTCDTRILHIAYCIQVLSTRSMQQLSGTRSGRIDCIGPATTCGKSCMSQFEPTSQVHACTCTYMECTCTYGTSHSIIILCISKCTTKEACKCAHFQKAKYIRYIRTYVYTCIHVYIHALYTHVFYTHVHVSVYIQVHSCQAIHGCHHTRGGYW